MIFRITLLFTIIFSNFLFSQISDVQVGSTVTTRTSASGAYYDYSEPTSINIKVAVWGYVRNPGRYVVPSGINLMELLSYAGGPTIDAKLEDLRLFRPKSGGDQEIISINYQNLLWGDAPKGIYEFPEVLPGDVILVTGEPRFFFKDYFTLTLQIISTLISLTLFIITLSK